MFILGINPGSHDSSACLLKDGTIIAAAAEERFTRRKHSIDQMPLNASQYCLREAGLSLDEIDYVATCWNSPYQQENSVHICTQAQLDRHRSYYEGSLFPRTHFNYRQLPKIAHISHHLSHAASVYRTQTQDNVAILVIDGQGDTVSTTLALGRENQIITVDQYVIKDSLGYFYQAVSSYLGFGFLGGEGSTMGLAPYGQRIYDFPEIQIDGGRYHCNFPLDIEIQNSFKDILSAWKDILTSQFGPPRQTKTHYDFTSGSINYDQLMSDLHRNIAASAQLKLEEIVIHIAQNLLSFAKMDTLLFAGGVALNASLNEKLITATSAKNLILFPAAGDDGAAVGAAAELANYLGETSRVNFPGALLGPSFSTEQVVELLTSLGIPFHHCNDPVELASKMLQQSKIIGWFQGRMEFGPRALGNRSILALPVDISVRDFINERVKHRELWRPLAPSVLAEHSTSIFGRETFSPYMLRAISVAREAAPSISATVHVDGTARAQTLQLKGYPLFTELVSKVCQDTKIPAVLNTSFNGRNEPIVCSPLDAIRTYMTSDLHCLFINDIVLDAKAFL